MPTNYVQFPNPSEWPTDGVDFGEADSRSKLSEALALEPPTVLAQACDVVKRMAAIETGAIENLYENDRGFTITAAMQSAVLEALRVGDENKKHALIASQMRAYDYVLDLVTKSLPLVESWMRELHAVLCNEQETYTAYSADGAPTQVLLPKGQYKTQDNHVKTATGIHYYAPALDTPAEMQRFAANLNSKTYQEFHPVDQAAYIHYAFAAIHPFADGNGRVARALASIPTYRQFRVPLLISVDHRTEYFDALASADKGSFYEFRIFIRNRLSESVDLLAQSVRTAKRGSPDENVERMMRNFMTRGGYSHVSLDEAADGLLTIVHEHLDAVLKGVKSKASGLLFSVAYHHENRVVQSEQHRRVLSRQERLVRLHGVSSPPAHSQCLLQVGVEVPKDASENDYFVLECGKERPGLSVQIPVRDVLPRRSMFAEMRATMFAEEVFGALGEAVAEQARQALRNQGYIENANK